MLCTVIVWESGVPNLPEILYELNSNYNIKYAKHIIWKKREICSNLNHLYPNRNFNLNSPKIKEIGGNNLYVFVVEVKQVLSYSMLKHHPLYYYKQKLRQRDKINYIHVSDNEEEAKNNFLALDNSYDKSDFHKLKKSHSKKYLYDSNLLKLKPLRNQGFNNLDFLFNQIKDEKYVVLRGFENKESMLYGDIDILCENKFTLLSLISPEKVFLDDQRTQYIKLIGNKIVQLDIRDKNDGYYPKKFSLQILDNSIFFSGIKVPSSHYYFWSLLYHCIIHKNFVDNKYKLILKNLNKVNNNIQKLEFGNLKHIRKELKKYLKRNNFKVSIPTDYSVSINKYGNEIDKFYHIFLKLYNRLKLTSSSNLKNFPEINEKIKSKEIKRLKRNVYSTNNEIIKLVPRVSSFQLINEYSFLNKLKKYSYFPKPLSIYHFNSYSVIFLENFKIKDLSKFIYLNKEEIKLLHKEFKIIKEIFLSEKIAHRDIRPNNILFENKIIKVIDFEYAMSFSSDIKCKDIYQKWVLDRRLKNLGGSWNNQQLEIKKIDDLAFKNVLNFYKNKKLDYINFYKTNFNKFINYK